MDRRKRQTATASPGKPGGRLTIEMRDGCVTLGPDEHDVVPPGVEHCPTADEETEILLIEPEGTPSTGDPATTAPTPKIQPPMLLIPCPYCNAERPELEFRYGGEAHFARPVDPNAVNDADWAEYLYFRSNPKGLLAERWRHAAGCGRYFNCLRDTASDKILAAYKAGEPRPAFGGENGA